MNEYLIALSALFIFGSGLTVIISCAQVDRLEKGGQLNGNSN